jgi:glycosyltransferase involved in cell wall biosynthesis
MKTLLQVIVHAGFPSSFRNAVRSVLEHTDDDVLAIYNGIDEYDNPDLSALSLDQPGRRVDVVVRDNSGHPKVGGLYGAYNLGLAHAQSRYRYVSFVQGDMQMMSWDKNTGDLLDLAFSLESPRVFAVGMAIGCRGALDHPALLDKDAERDSGSDEFNFNPLRAVADVAIYSMDLVNRESFEFEVDEEFSCSKMRGRGYTSVSLKKPRLAFVPWPATVRDGFRRGAEPPVRDGQSYLKILVPKIGEEHRSVGGTWAEDLIVPNGYRTLFPYWPSDTYRPKWIARRRDLAKRMGISFFAAIDSRGRVRSYLWPSKFKRSPKLSYILYRLAAGPLKNIFDLVRRYARDGLRRLGQ